MQIIKNTDAIIQIVKNVGDHFLYEFRKNEIPQNKDDFFKALKIIEDKCFSELKKSIDLLYPEVPWAEDDELNEELQQKPSATTYWLCDTMDGAIQYLQHITGWTINLVLIDQGEPIFSIIYDPYANEVFHAEKGVGAYLNKKKMTPSNKTSPISMVAVIEYGHQLKKELDWRENTSLSFIKLLEVFWTVRNYGPHGLQLAYLGAGRIDLFIQNDLDTNNWLAGILIIKEAGGKILSTDGSPWKWGDKGLLAGTNEALKYYLNTK